MDDTGEQLYLTIQDGVQGKTKLLVKKGENYTVELEAERGWSICSVTYNEADVTSQLGEKNRFTTPAITTDAVLRVVYEQLNTRAVDTEVQNISVRAVKGGVIIDNANEGSVCQVFLTSGALLKTVTIKEISEFVSLSEGQTYIVNVGGKTLKVAQ